MARITVNGFPHARPARPAGILARRDPRSECALRECFKDEFAHAAGVDPLAFRRKLMADHPKHPAVLEAVAERIGWNRAPPPGAHRGLAQVMGYGSYVAAAAEVSVSDGQLKIHRIVAATDPGSV
jgi:isoquinoline 1-oxidoreductase beta subunit